MSGVMLARPFDGRIWKVFYVSCELKMGGHDTRNAGVGGLPLPPVASATAPLPPTAALRPRRRSPRRHPRRIATTECSLYTHTRQLCKVGRKPGVMQSSERQRLIINIMVTSESLHSKAHRVFDVMQRQFALVYATFTA
jgi:hypothetical protein